jgi:hypothetical protein
MTKMDSLRTVVIAFKVAMRVLVRHQRNVRQNGNRARLRLSHGRKEKAAKNGAGRKRRKVEVKAEEPRREVGKSHLTMSTMGLVQSRKAKLYLKPLFPPRMMIRRKKVVNCASLAGE